MSNIGNYKNGKVVLRTIQEWFEEMEEPEKSLAIANAHENILKKEVNQFYKAIDGAFLWENTREGVEYWKSIRAKYN